MSICGITNLLHCVLLLCHFGRNILGFPVFSQTLHNSRTRSLQVVGKLLAEELDSSHIQHVNDLVAVALGDKSNEKNDVDASSKANRYSIARSMASNDCVSSTSQSEDGEGVAPTNHQLVYGELSIPCLATILDAVGVHEGEQFLDIGSGDGALVLGASLLYPRYIKRSLGVEILPGLLDRSRQHLAKLKSNLQDDRRSNELLDALDSVEFCLGDVYQATTECAENGTLLSVLRDTTLAVCFATTWSSSNTGQKKSSLNGRKLPQLSNALKVLPSGARTVIVDGKLNEADGYSWQGDLQVFCPDTAPYSIASLYHRV